MLGKTAVSGATQAVSNASNSVTTGASQIRQAATNGLQARNAITGEQGYTGQYASGAQQKPMYTGGLSASLERF